MEFYSILCSMIFLSLFFLCLLSLKFEWLKKNLVLLTILLLGILVTIIYISNPVRRIFSFHGFIHASIVYQVAEGNIPPFNPFLGGNSLHYAWGYHVLTALIMKILDISPFIIFAFINIVAICFVGLLIYKISRVLIKDKTANCFSVIFALFGVFMWNPPLIRLVRQLTHTTIERRAVPALVKFTNINGAPLGLIFFTLFVYSVIQLFFTKKTSSSWAGLFISIIGCGFFYPAMYFGLIASTFFVCFASILLNKKSSFGGAFKKCLSLVLILVVCTIILWSYFSSISSGLNLREIFFTIDSSLLNKIFCYLLYAIPTLILFFISRSFLVNKTNRDIFLILFSVIIATFTTYVFIKLPASTEYKSLILSTLMLGLIGGLAFYMLWNRFNKYVLFIILCALLVPYINEKNKFIGDPGQKMPFTESGKYLKILNQEEDELYQWIKNNTIHNSLFIDTKITIPLFAQRQLFIALNMEKTPGYRLDFLQEVCRYDVDLIISRKRIVQKIFNSTGSISNEELKTLHNIGADIYVVGRQRFIEEKFDPDIFCLVFRSSNGQFTVFRLADSRF